MGVIDSGMAESGGYCPTSQGNTGQTVGASLLAKAVSHPADLSTDPPLSRAGSLPQGIRGDQE
ncbi:hypothetical protein PkoCFBP13504_25635 [Pseudomonas koreensis]|nr:hypothetical protein PkoCFBP13504_25635 [Pseudomonas koreensis]